MSKFEKLFKTNRKSFGNLDVDKKLIKLLDKYSSNNKKNLPELEKIYTMMNTLDLPVLKKIIVDLGLDDLKNPADLSLNELIADLDVTSDTVKDFKSTSKVYIGIVTVNGEDKKFEKRNQLILQALRSVRDLRYSNKTVGVFINNLNESKINKITKEYKKCFSSVGVYGNEKNLGASGGRNFLVDKAKELGYDYILFIDDDSYFNDSLLIEKLLFFYNKYPNTAFIGPEITYSDYRVLFNGYNFMIDSTQNRLRSKDWVEVDFVENSCLMVKLDRVGEGTEVGEYPDYKYYHEEAFLAWKAVRIAKYRNLLVTGARHVHLRDGGGLVNKHSFYYFIRNFFYLFKDMQKLKKFTFMQKFYIYSFFYVNGVSMVLQKDKLSYIPIFIRGCLAGYLYYWGLVKK